MRTMRPLRYSHIQMLRYAGLFTYAWVGMPLLITLWNKEMDNQRAMFFAWMVSYVVFGLSYWRLTHELTPGVPTRWRTPLMLVMCGSWMAIGYFSQSGLPGILLMVLAGVLPWLYSARVSLVCLTLINFSLIPIFAYLPTYGWFMATLQCVLYYGFAIFTFVTSLVAKEQAEAREEQRRLNSELRATRAVLAESTRINERVRISRELHDLLGHHLTALSLNLEVASHMVGGPAQERVRQAQSIAKLLLSDVREAVSLLRADEDLPLEQALKTLIDGIPEPAIHLEVPTDLGVGDSSRAQVLLRCTQEIITNAIRHSRARNLWLRIDNGSDGAIYIHARDDGQGTTQLVAGNGLSGMRERLAQFGGGVKIDTAPGAGFALDAWIPKEKAA